MKRLAIVAFLLMIAGGTVFSQSEDSVSHYDQHKAFAPFFYPSNGNEYRSASGQPGPAYWQNRADYKINVSLDTADQNSERNGSYYLQKQQPRCFKIFMASTWIKIFTGKIAAHKLRV